MASASARADGAAPARVRALRERFARVRAATVALARPLSEADASVQSMPDASPTKWHLAHTTWFFETFALERFEPAFAPHDPAYRVLFNSYYNSIGEQHPRPLRGLVTRPGLAEVLAYRAAVDARVERLLDAPPDALCDLVELGLEHEQQHQELVLTDLQHALAQNPLLPAYAPRPQRPAERVATPLAWAAFDEALCEIGDAGAGFAFDNERPRHRVFVEAFEIASRAVTNGEWIAFVEDGGYATPSLWLSDGWTRRCAEGWEAPLYWQRAEAGAPWERFTLGGLVPAHADEPVCHVSYYEADAFATWAGARLPTEAEWERTAERFAP
ncbi:MAG: ergothioneine biosynthesis protein EgtB, partial [Myxococcales bacterium]|nr:ergothioneine biosynthesis protein EgtB [Myxococcales bacterium]